MKKTTLALVIIFLFSCQSAQESPSQEIISNKLDEDKQALLKRRKDRQALYEKQLVEKAKLEKLQKEQRNKDQADWKAKHRYAFDMLKKILLTRKRWENFVRWRHSLPGYEKEFATEKVKVLNKAFIAGGKHLKNSSIVKLAGRVAYLTLGKKGAPT